MNTSRELTGQDVTNTLVFVVVKICHALDLAGK